MTISIKPTASGSTIEQDGSTVLSIESDRSVDIDSGTLHVDATNNNVGVGTSSPATKLHVEQSTTGEAFRVARGGNYLIMGGSGSGTQYVKGYESVVSFGNIYGGPTTFLTNDTERMRIDSNGRVTMPYQPAFSVVSLTYSGNGSTGTGGTVYVNIGSHYNSTNGRFTAPIAGTYLFFGSQQYYGSGSTTYVELDFSVNGTIVATYPSGGAGAYNNHFCQTGTIIVSLSVNDYVTIYASYGSRNQQNNFGGYLIG
jgi:hypothetical protein